MYNILLFAHNLLRWVILILLVINILRHLMNARKPWTKTDNSLGLILMIAAHITLLIGLYQWVFNDLGLKAIQTSGFKAVMGNSASRFWAIEHLTGMLIAIILITVGKGVGRKAMPDKIKHRRAGFLFLIALLVIMLVTPWPFRKGISRPLNPADRLESIR